MKCLPSARFSTPCEVYVIVISEKVESTWNLFTCKLHTNGLAQWCYLTEYASQGWRQVGQWYVNHSHENSAFFWPEKDMWAISNTIFIYPHIGRSVSRSSLSRSYASAWSSVSPAFSCIHSTSSRSTQVFFCLVFGTSFGFFFLVLAEPAFWPALRSEPMFTSSPSRSPLDSSSSDELMPAAC